MNELKNKVSESQKAAQKKYDQKTKMLSIKYTPSDMKDYERLKKYLDTRGESINGFIKGLIKSYLESGQTQQSANEVNKNLTENIFYTYSNEYNPCYYINKENIDYFKDKFGEKILAKLLDEFSESIKSEVEDILVTKGCDFDDWTEDFCDRMEEGEFQTDTQEDLTRQIIEDMLNYLL